MVTIKTFNKAKKQNQNQNPPSTEDQKHETKTPQQNPNKQMKNPSQDKLLSIEKMELV